MPYDGRNVDGWFASEIIQGTRAFWDGSRLWRQRGDEIRNHPFHLPPGIALDGEIWAGRGQFRILRVALQSGIGWEQVRFLAFDAPHAQGGWIDRIALAARAGVDIVPHRRVITTAEAMRLALDIIRKGGEGIWLHHPHAAYTKGRTESLLKVQAYNLPAAYYNMPVA